MGLVALPCDGTGPLRAADPAFCDEGRNFVTPQIAKALEADARALAARSPGAVMRYMDASWPSGRKPMPPHLSHGDGHAADIALLFQTQDGRALDNSPVRFGYGAFEPPRREAERACVGRRPANAEKPDPPPGRTWRLDEARSRALILTLAADPHVRRIFLEPHLKVRLGLTDQRKIAFAGCQAARHDDHVHVDFY